MVKNHVPSLPHSPAFSPTARYKQIPSSSQQSTAPDLPFLAAKGVTSELSPLFQLQNKKRRLGSNSVYIPTKEMQDAQSHLRDTFGTLGSPLPCSLSWCPTQSLGQVPGSHCPHVSTKEVDPITSSSLPAAVFPRE